jgi:hypothetical protein
VNAQTFTKQARKFKQTSARKLMTAVLWDRKGVLMVEFMQQVTTVISEVYCKTLKKLCRAIPNKRRGMLTYSVVLLHDNACLHTAARTRALLEHFNCELFEHPPSPHTALILLRVTTNCYIPEELVGITELQQ